MSLRGGAALLTVALLTGTGAGTASSGGTPGVTSSSILLGGTFPLSGPASAFGVVGASAAAYFKYVNAHGGVHHRRVTLKVLDDGYDPSRTVEETRRLVQQDGVFAIFGSVGTEHALAVRPYLNHLKVPQLFVGTGSSDIARNHKRYPWTMGYLPSFQGEGAIYGRYIVRKLPRARIGLLYEASPYGQDLLTGLQRGLGAHGRLIVAKQSYDVTETNVSAQIARLKSSGANTLMIVALPPFSIQAFIYAYKLGWRPHVFLSAVSVEPTVMSIARTNTHGQTTEGTISVAFLKDPTSPRWARDPAVALYRRILRKYDAGAKPTDVYNFYGMAVAFTMVDALRHAGRKLTRADLLRAATHLNERDNPFLIPGIPIKTRPNDYFPIAEAEMFRYHGALWRRLGPLVNARG